MVGEHPDHVNSARMATRPVLSSELAPHHILRPERDVPAHAIVTNMSIFDEWARFAADIIHAESKLIADIINHPTRIGTAREVLIKGILSRVLPSAYEIGSGQIVDSERNISKQIDIIIARRDFPALRFSDGTAQYLVESVLATIEIKSQLTKDTMFEALENCRSVGELKALVDKSSLMRRLKQLNLDVDENNALVANSMTREAVLLKGRPVSFIFGFSGYKERVEDFEEAIKAWARSQKDIRLKKLPLLIVAERFVAYRNQFGAVINNGQEWPLLLVSENQNPLGTFIRFLLNTIQMAVPATPNAEGIQPSLTQYLGLDMNITGRPLLIASMSNPSATEPSTT